MPDQTHAQPRAVFFDLDDTLMDYTGGVQDSWRAACEHFSPSLAIDSGVIFQAIEEYREWYWNDRDRHAEKRLDMRAARREIVVESLARLGCGDIAAAHGLADMFTQSREDGFQLFPETIETLTRFRDAGVKLALLTNGHPTAQRPKIDRFGLADFFDCIVVEGEFGVGKPHPSVYRHALREVGVLPSETWMVGDNLEWDVHGAQQVGIFAIWRDLTGSGLPSGSTVTPDRIIRSLTELWPSSG